MTITVDTNKISQVGNGVATSFSFSPLKLQKSSDLRVILVEDASGTETELTEGSGDNDYTVVVSSYPGTGSITYPNDLTPVATGYTLYFLYGPEELQETKLSQQGGYDPKVQENTFDFGRIIDLSQQELIDRSLKFKASFSGTLDVEIPEPTALGYLQVSSDGLSLQFTTLATTDGSASNSTPQPVSLSAGAAGANPNYARDDHVHKLNVSADMALFLATANDAAARTELGLGAVAVLATIATAYLDNSAVTAAKLASDAVTTVKILDANVTIAKLQKRAQTAVRLALYNLS